jgi:hypothetical protein
MYVQDPSLHEGQKLPKWELRCRKCQYMGASPLHAGTVALVRNLQTGSITPQFHVAFDNFFEMVPSDSSDPPPNWAELIIFSSFRADINKDGITPELTNEWLSPDELYQQQLKDRERKNHVQPPKQEGQEGVTLLSPPQSGTQEQPWEPINLVSPPAEHPTAREPAPFFMREPPPERDPPSNLRQSGRTTKGQHGPQYGYDKSQSAG